MMKGKNSEKEARLRICIETQPCFFGVVASVCVVAVRGVFDIGGFGGVKCIARIATPASELLVQNSTGGEAGEY